MLLDLNDFLDLDLNDLHLDFLLEERFLVSARECARSPLCAPAELVVGIIPVPSSPLTRLARNKMTTATFKSIIGIAEYKFFQGKNYKNVF